MKDSVYFTVINIQNTVLMIDISILSIL